MGVRLGNARPSLVRRALAWEGVTSEQLAQAESVVGAWPGLLGPALRACELALSSRTRTLVVVARFDSSEEAPWVRARFDFWASQVPGGQSGNVTASRLMDCDLRGTVPGDFFDRAWQALGGVRPPVRTLALRLSLWGAPGCLDISEASENVLYVACANPPPFGDRFAVRFLELEGETAVRVSRVVPTSTSTVARTGFELTLLDPSAAVRAALRDRASSLLRQRNGRV